MKQFQLLLTQFLPNFKGRFLEPSLTDANRYGDICPYQEYISCCCYRLYFDHTFKVDSKKIFDFLFLEPDHFTQNFWTQRLKKILTPNFFGPLFFGTLIFWTKTFWDLTFFWPKFSFGSNTFLDMDCFWIKNCLDLICFDKNNQNNNNNHNHNFNGFWHNWN